MRTYRGLFLGSCVLALASVASSWWFLPSGRIPVHFGAGGEPDGWGTRSELAGALAAVVVGLALFMGWLGSKVSTMSWQWINLPHKEVWQRPEHEPRARARLTQDFHLIGAWTMWFLATLPPLVGRSVVQATDRGSGDDAEPVVVLALCALLVVASLWRFRWYAAPPQARA